MYFPLPHLPRHISTPLLLDIFLFEPVLWIRISFNAAPDPDPAVYLNADPDPDLESQTKK